VGTIVAIFDLDGTLYTGHVTKGIALHHQQHRVKRLPLYLYLITHVPLWYLRRAGIMSEAALRELWVRNLGWTVRGWTPSEAAVAFTWITEQYVRPRLRLDVVARLTDHQAMGHRVILVSGTFSPLLAEVGRQLGVRETVGTPLLIRDGHYTGACEIPVCQGPNKVLRLETYLHGSDDVEWSSSYAYADSYTDLPLLERVGHPVAAYPDSRLAAVALEREWEILGGEPTSVGR